jgi:hypothetical protein
MQLCFVSVHGPRETYFADEPRISYDLAQQDAPIKNQELKQFRRVFPWVEKE